MLKSEFKLFWEGKFPESYPIGSEMKNIFKERWFRIHSLPNSKRYAETDEDYQIIFDKQNKIIEDVLGEDEEIILLIGLSDHDLSNENYKEISEFNEFEKVDRLELHKIIPTADEDEIFVDILMKATTWKSNKRNDILKAIADDEIRMMFVSFNKNRIVIPYDGGIDIVLESKDVKNFFKEKYSNWLSNHSEGL